jgi:hypothetical protein
VIRDFECPSSKVFSKELVASLSKFHIRFLIDCRPISITMGNTIAYVKRIIEQLDPSKSLKEVTIDVEIEAGKWSHFFLFIMNRPFLR